MSKLGVRVVAGFAVLTLAAGMAQAQNCVGRPDFDACMAATLGRQRSQLAASQQRLWQSYLRSNGPWLRRQYSQYRGPPMSFERFAYYSMMTANGTNVAGGLQAQRDQFAGSQRAHATVQQGYDSYRQGMYANSARTSRTAERFDQQVIRGNSAQMDPTTGRTRWLPDSAPAGQPFTSGGRTYVQTPQGYYQWTGSGWTPMQPGR